MKELALGHSSVQTVYPSSRAHSAGLLAFLLFLEHNKHTSTSGPLHLFFSLFEVPFPKSVCTLLHQFIQLSAQMLQRGLPGQLI